MDVRDPNTYVRGIYISSQAKRSGGGDKVGRAKPRAGAGGLAKPRSGAAGRPNRRYHHGDLPATLADAALELVGEQGVNGFTVTEVARRVGVSSAAPYRHYASREHLLAAVALRGYRELGTAFEAALESAGPRPADRLAACAGAYVRFAAEHPAMFEVLFGAGLEKDEHPELRAASDALIATVWPIVAPLTPERSEEQIWALIQAVVGLAHGYAALLLDGALQHFTPAGAACEVQPTAGSIPLAQIEAAETQAVAATRALLRGRSRLFP